MGLISEYIDLRDVVAALDDEQHGAHEAACRVYGALVADGLLQDVDGLEQQAEDDPVMIREDVFPEYARELAEEVGAVDPDAGWPVYCIDWDAAARELQHDYAAVDVDGSRYWVRWA